MKTIYSDDGISKALKGVFKRRHIPSYYHRLDEVDFVDACAETARGRLGYALFQDHVADELIDDMTMTISSSASSMNPAKIHSLLGFSMRLH